MDGPFRFTGNNDSGDSHYEGRFELPNDGTPDSDRYLVFTVEQRQDGFHVSLSVDYPELKTEKHITSCVTTNVKGIAELLYPVARIRTITTLVTV